MHDTASTSVPICVLQTDPAAELAKPGYQFKAVFNERGIILAPGAVQHKDTRVPGIWYDHDHKGNALAAMIYNGRFEIRGHSAFPPERVRVIVVKLAKLSGMALLRGFAVTYRNQSLGKL